MLILNFFGRKTAIPEPICMHEKSVDEEGLFVETDS